jgi:hypothetical protein
LAALQGYAAGGEHHGNDAAGAGCWITPPPQVRGGVSISFRDPPGITETSRETRTESQFPPKIHQKKLKRVKKEERKVTTYTAILHPFI